MKLFNNYLRYGLLILGIFKPEIGHAMLGFSWSSLSSEEVEDIRESEQIVNFFKAVESGKIDEIRACIEQGIDINSRKIIRGRFYFPFYEAIKQATDSYFNFRADREIRYQIVELFLEDGAKINEELGYNRTALEFALYQEHYEFQLIRLLLNYGAEITDKALECANKKSNSKEINAILSFHEKLRDESLMKPTEKLLTYAIGYNNVCIIKLIINAKPELVALSDIKLARVNSAASVLILTRVFGIIKIRELANKKELPVELREHIERFAVDNQ